MKSAVKACNNIMCSMAKKYKNGIRNILRMPFLYMKIKDR